jgi:hypothetical protein
MQFLKKDSLTLAASILATEARQASFVGTEVVGVAPWGTAFEVTFHFDFPYVSKLINAITDSY